MFIDSGGKKLIVDNFDNLLASPSAVFITGAIIPLDGGTRLV